MAARYGVLYNGYLALGSFVERELTQEARQMLQRGSHMIDLRKNAELWFLTGSQHLYGDETLKQSPKTRAPSPIRWIAPASSPRAWS